MMYNNKLAVALKSNGNVLREFGETVYVPFGSEFSVLVKNLNSGRALVTITIDGEDVGDGRQFIINGNDEVELERFIKNGNLDSGNRFKFIERTDGVEEHRGVGIEDGIVRVEFQFEKKLEILCSPHIRPQWYHDSWNSGNPPPFGLLRGASNTFGAADTSVNYSAQITCDSFDLCSQEEPVANDAGITVPGSESNQKFTTGDSFPVESETHVIVLQMLGQTEDNKPVAKPVTVKAKPKCVTCGRVNKATAKFCSECGTSLNII